MKRKLTPLSIILQFASLILFIMGCGVDGPTLQSAFDATVETSIQETVEARVQTTLTIHSEIETRVHATQTADYSIETTIDAIGTKVEAAETSIIGAVETTVHADNALEATVEAVAASVDDIYATQTASHIAGATAAALETTAMGAVETEIHDAQATSAALEATVDSMEVQVDAIYAMLTVQPPLIVTPPLTVTITPTQTESPTPTADAPTPLAPHPIYVGQTLSSGYDMGVDTSGQLRNWVADEGGQLCMAYPSNQQWGAVFITVGVPKEPPRPGRDLSNYQTLSLELRGASGGEFVSVGLKDSRDPDNGRETKEEISGITTSWQIFTFPLTDFDTADLTSLYVVTEFVFEPGTPAETICFRNI